jgi:hypothetical protein
MPAHGSAAAFGGYDMLYTLAQAKTLVSPFCTTGGACPSTPVVLDRINEACRRLLEEGRADWDQTQRMVRLCTKLCTVTLPREFRSARIAGIDRGAADIFPTNYQYLEWGPGLESCGEHYGLDLMDLGDGFPTFFDIPDDEDVEYFLFAASTAISDASLSLFVEGMKVNGEAVLQSSGVPGYTLPIAAWSNGVEGTLTGYPDPVSTIPFSAISSIKLPAGRKQLTP